MIGPVIAAVLPLMRANAESLMTDRCTVDREGGSEWNGTETVTTWATVHVDLPAHFEEPAVTSRTLLTDEAVTENAPTLKFPVATAGIKPDDRVTLTASGARSTAPVGAVLWVTHVAVDTDAVECVVTCRRTR